MIPPAFRTRIEKTATDNGFELHLPPRNEWLAFAGSQTRLRLWITADADKRLYVAMSQRNVLEELQAHAATSPAPVPEDAYGTLGADDIPSLDRLLLRIFQLSIALPDELLHIFERQTATLPKTTETERLVVQRVGQDIFRAGLRKYWHDQCCLSGLSIPELLRASHIKPWAHCETDAERLNVHNGLLLAPHYDAAFDGGFFTVEDDGTVCVSPRVSTAARLCLQLDKPLHIPGIRAEHAPYLRYHRVKVFRGA